MWGAQIKVSKVLTRIPAFKLFLEWEGNESLLVTPLKFRINTTNNQTAGGNRTDLTPTKKSIKNQWWCWFSWIGKGNDIIAGKIGCNQVGTGVTFDLVFAHDLIFLYLNLMLFSPTKTWMLDRRRLLNLAFDQIQLTLVFQKIIFIRMVWNKMAMQWAR